MVDFRHPPGLGLRLIATLVVLIAAYFLVGLAIQGRSVAPVGAVLRPLPLAPLALLHGLVLLLHAWWPRLPARLAAAAGWVVLLLGMILVAGGTDAAVVQFDRFGVQGLTRGHALPLGLLVAAQGALGVLVVWSRRAPTP